MKKTSQGESEVRIVPMCVYSSAWPCCPPCCVCAETPNPHPLRHNVPVTSGSCRCVGVSAECVPHRSLLCLSKISAVLQYCHALFIVTAGVCITVCDRLYIQIQVCIRCKASVSVCHFMFTPHDTVQGAL